MTLLGIARNQLDTLITKQELRHPHFEVSISFAIEHACH